MRIRIQWSMGEVFARLDDTTNGRAVLATLPLRATATTSGEAINFGAVLPVKPEDGERRLLAPGTLCYRRDTASIALLLVPTLVPFEVDCRKMARYGVLGTLESDLRALRTIWNGHLLSVSRVEEELRSPCFRCECTSQDSARSKSPPFYDRFPNRHDASYRSQYPGVW